MARRLPPEYGAASFVDLVSTPGSTLRMLPWTRVGGDRVTGEGEELARALVELVMACCPEAKLDAATRTFLADHQSALQLPDLDTLAAHDQRLA